jgi:hypothetical protein
MTGPKYPEIETVPEVERLPSSSSFKDKFNSYKQYLTSKHGWFGDYVSPYQELLLICVQDYLFLITPNLPLMKKVDRRAPFYALNSTLPVVLALLLGYLLVYGAS